MEFFKIVDIPASEEKIRAKLMLQNLDQFSSQLFLLEQPSTDEVALIGSVWGTFNLRRHEIQGGLRFALEECPNALCWTITTGYPPAADAIILHLTLNRIEVTREFHEEVDEFLKDHAEHLMQGFKEEQF